MPIWPLGSAPAARTDDSCWKPCKENYLFNARAMSSQVLRGKFMAHLKKACQCGQIKMAGDEFNQFKARLYEKHWIIDVHEPVKNPAHVIEYLARYTHQQPYQST